MQHTSSNNRLNNAQPMLRMQACQAVAQRTTTTRRALTLIELLVVLGVITVLTTLVFGGIGKTREKMRQTQEVSSARFLINTFHSISTDKGRLFSAVEYNSGTSSHDQAEDIRYPTHMIPYTGEDEFYKALYFHPEQQELVRKTKRHSGSNASYVISIYPALGMNAPAVGGEYYDGQLQDNPANVSRAHEVNHPERLIVFISAGSSSAGLNLGNSIINGYFKVSSPYISRIPTFYLWGKARESSPSNTGNVHFRWDGQAVAAFFDGSVRMVDEETVADPRYWLNDTGAFNF